MQRITMATLYAVTDKLRKRGLKWSMPHAARCALRSEQLGLASVSKSVLHLATPAFGSMPWTIDALNTLDEYAKKGDFVATQTWGEM